MPAYEVTWFCTSCLDIALQSRQLEESLLSAPLEPDNTSNVVQSEPQTVTHVPPSWPDPRPMGYDESPTDLRLLKPLKRCSLKRIYGRFANDIYVLLNNGDADAALSKVQVSPPIQYELRWINEMKGGLKQFKEKYRKKQPLKWFMK